MKELLFWCFNILVLILSYEVGKVAMGTFLHYYK